jgi:glycine betaine catabolism B
LTLNAFIKDVRREAARAALVRLDLAGAAFPFTAGQAVMAGLAGQPDRKPYSIACSPEQARESGCLELLVKIDQQGRAGRHLGHIQAGASVEVTGPMGSFSLAGIRATSPLLLVAGGTGIAPLRSMLWSALASREAPPITLLYSARTPDEFAFLAEFRRLHGEGRIRLRLTATRGAGQSWTGGRRRIDRDLLAELVERPSTVCLVCGPDSLVADVPALLRSLGVPAGRIRREEY